MKKKKSQKTSLPSKGENQNSKKTSRMNANPKKGKYKHMSHWLDDDDYYMPDLEEE